MINLKQELNKFSNDLIEIGEPIQDDRIEKVEKILNHKLPPIFKSTFQQMNSFSLYGNEVYGFAPLKGQLTLNDLYNIEHFEVGNPMPENVIPFSPDGGGNHYCIDLTSSNPEQVLFWVHDLELTDDGQLEICNSNIVDWFQEIINNVLEDYDYLGNEK
jgi:cell wall assembly regulator SMI1